VGPRAVLVAKRLEEIADAISIRCGARTAAAKNRAYRDDASGNVPDEAELPELSGTVLMSVSHIEPSDAGGSAAAMPATTKATVARIVAEAPEDITRIVAACLSPLEADFAMVPFEDRIYADAPKMSDGHGQQSQVDDDDELRTPSPVDGQGSGRKFRQQLSADQTWTLMQLSDATLPTGGFAHSGGLEVSSMPVHQPPSPDTAASAAITCNVDAVIAADLLPYVVRCPVVCRLRVSSASWAPASRVSGRAGLGLRRPESTAILRSCCASFWGRLSSHREGSRSHMHRKLTVW